MALPIAPRAGRALALALLAACGGGSPDVPVAPPPGGGTGGTAPPARPVLPATYRPTGRAAAGDAFVHLFEWRWADVAAECERELGPAGWRAVQVAPPQEHAVVAGAPWWQRYQPVSYALDRSRSGTGAEFTAMVARCRAAGVDVYVDAVVNHMTAGAGTGSAGTVYTKYEYPGLWTRADFHAPCEIRDYQSAAEVQDCELLGLADLNTGAATVRQRLADYLVALARLGVAGFRLDAAKHVQPAELDDVLARANRTLAAEGRALPYVFAEVIDYGREVVRAQDYFGLGHASGGAADVTEFRYRGIGDKFLPLAGQRVSDLRTFSTAAWGVIPSDKAVTFVENHDTQRDGGLWYRDGQALRLAYVWLLGYPYGYPSVLSGYAFQRGTPGRDAGPPSAGDGTTRPAACPARFEDAAVGEWTCEHRDPVIRAMIGFRRAVAGTDADRLWDNGGMAIAFSRGARGFVAISRERAPLAAAVPSALPGGTYCDLLSGGRLGSGASARCAGTRVTVDADGTVRLALPADAAIALHVDARL